jgi:7-cyano-7-deazaguanine synthase
VSKQAVNGVPAVVLVSGGLDSAVALAVMRRDGYGCHALSFDYGQRHRHELVAAERVAEAGGAASHRVVAVDLRTIGGSALTADIEVPKDRPSGHAGIPATYVPGRNLIFLSLAVAHAEVLGAWDIAYGANSVDYSGYPDCRSPFISAFVEAANLATKAWDEADRRSRRPIGFTVHAPLINLTKVEIIRLGAELGVDYSLTHSCYDPTADGVACGRCDSCTIRARGFDGARVPDPTCYAEPASGRGR